MLLADMFIGRSDFASPEEIKEFIRRSKNFDKSKEDPSTAHPLLIFKTSKQQTWLVATPERLYCVLDDLRKDAPHINWSMPRAQLVVDSKIAIPIRMHERSRTIGKVDIGGRHKNWLYSKALFADRNIETNIRDLIYRAMIGE